MDIRVCDQLEILDLCQRYHSYKTAGSYSAYCFGVYEQDRLVAAYSWMPPALGAAKSVCPEAPQGVLALSRMVAVPREERLLRHVSKPLRIQMRRLIDRGRWPVLVTYSDEGDGHTGHVYKCSGWHKTERRRRPVYTDNSGVRQSVVDGRYLTLSGYTWLQRWEHWVCDSGTVNLWMESHGWYREPIPGKVWRSGNQAYRYVQREVGV